MRAILADLKAFFTSLRLTVVLLACSILLVWVATWMQKFYGIRFIETEYFHSFVAPIRYPDWNYAIPIPGGYLVGGLLFINLLCSQLVRIPLRWNRLGLHLSHFGILLLLVGELWRGVGSEESQMRLDEGATGNFSESIHERELAVTDVTAPDRDVVHAVPLSRLAGRKAFAIPGTPLTLAPQTFLPNATLAMRDAAPGAPSSAATAGVGPQVVVAPQPETFRTDEMNFPTAFVEVRAGGAPLGVWLVSLQLEAPQEFTHDGRTYRLSLRRTRHYQDFSLTLLDFRHDKYPGTEIPRNFSSQVRVASDDGKENRETKIYMNNPLRFRGLTFYQSGFDNNDTTSVFQVVRNDGWLIPYVACVVAAAGLLIHFLISLGNFLRRRAAANR